MSLSMMQFICYMFFPFLSSVSGYYIYLDMFVFVLFFNSTGIAIVEEA